jgi:hypothetical protein
MSEPGAFTLFGESVQAVATVDDPQAASVALERADDRAPYEPEQPNSIGRDVAADGRTGRLAFPSLVTHPASYPVDHLPVPRTEFGSPLGDDPSASSLRGALSWTCEPPSADFKPLATASPEPTPPLAVPDLRLSSGLAQRTGAAVCVAPVGAGWCRAGFSQAGFVSPDRYPPPLALRPGGKVELVPEGGWTITEWHVVSAPHEEIERSLGQPAQQQVLASGGGLRAESTVTLDAPADPGISIVRATVTLDGDAGMRAGTYVFLVRIGPYPALPPLDPLLPNQSSLFLLEGDEAATGEFEDPPGGYEIQVDCVGGGSVEIETTDTSLTQPCALEHKPGDRHQVILGQGPETIAITPSGDVHWRVSIRTPSS